MFFLRRGYDVVHVMNTCNPSFTCINDVYSINIYHVLTKIYGATVRQKNACIKVIFTSASTTVTWSDVPWTITGVVSLPFHLEFKKNINKHIDKILILCNIVVKIFFMHVIYFFSTYQFRFRSERWTGP